LQKKKAKTEDFQTKVQQIIQIYKKRGGQTGHQAQRMHHTHTHMGGKTNKNNISISKAEVTGPLKKCKQKMGR
jgi:hypothetical protein